MEVQYDLIGIKKILVNRKDLFGSISRWTSYARHIRPAELVLDADFGDAWGQRIEEFNGVQLPISQIALGDYNTSVECDGTAIRWRGRYRGGDPMVKTLSWVVTCRASEDGRRLDFTTEVDWDTRSRRLRVLFPVKSQGKSATYEVPYGFIERAYQPEKLDYCQWKANTMEFPALHWVNKRIDDKCGVAVLNKGLPCNRWVTGGRFELSLVRSPEWGFAANEPVTYEFWDLDGLRDTGKHRFDYSLWPYVDAVNETELTQVGYAYNDAAPTHPFTVKGDAIVTAFKLAEDGKGWILRVQETAGQGSKVEIDFGKTINVCSTNLVEQPTAQPFVGKTHTLRLRSHEIHTLKICR